MTIYWKAVEQYITVVLFAFKFFLVCNFGKFINFELVIVVSERVKFIIYERSNRTSYHISIIESRAIDLGPGNFLL